MKTKSFARDTVPRAAGSVASAARGSAVASCGMLLLTRSDVAGLLDLPGCIAAVEKVYRLHAEGKAAPPGMLGMPVEGGGFHMKAATMPGAPAYFRFKRGCAGDVAAAALVYERAIELGGGASIRLTD